jgi:hypothetical protein
MGISDAAQRFVPEVLFPRHGNTSEILRVLGIPGAAPAPKSFPSIITPALAGSSRAWPFTLTEYTR